MQALMTFLHCDEMLKHAHVAEIAEVKSAVASVAWAQTHQAAYNREFATEFRQRGWESQPLLCTNPKLIGDFRKGRVFVELQFGNSATLYRDFYKFQYGWENGLISLAVLIVPTTPKRFFPMRGASINNMAEYANALDICQTVTRINVPTLIVGMLPDGLNEHARR